MQNCFDLTSLYAEKAQLGSGCNRLAGRHVWVLGAAPANHTAVLKATAVVERRDRSVRVRYGVDYRAANPYQHLLYRAAGPTISARPASVEAALTELSDQPGPMIYHLHWEDHALKVANSADAQRNVQALIDGLEALTGAGAKVVWTRHNLRPHDREHANLHAELTPHLTKIAAVVHVHSWPALEVLAKRDVTDPGKTVVIAHGNYVSHYADWPAPVARRGFGLTDANHVFLLFGRLGGYKQAGLAALAFASIANASARLIIAGVPDDPALESLPNDDRIQLLHGFVPDAEVGKFFAVADTVLLPYADSLTSGQAILAAGFSRGILGSDVAGIRDIVCPGVSGILVDPGDGTALAGAIAQALADGREVWHARGQAAGVTAAVRSWDGPGRQWRDLFQGLAAASYWEDIEPPRAVAP